MEISSTEHIEDDSEMYFEDDCPCCFIEIKSIGSINTSEITKTICDLGILGFYREINLLTQIEF